MNRVIAGQSATMQHSRRRGNGKQRSHAAKHVAFQLLAGLALCPAISSAQDPGTAPAVPKQLRIIAASLGGTGPDFIARLIAPKLGEALHQNVVVENRPSTNGLAAAQYAARAAPDGR